MASVTETLSAISGPMATVIIILFIGLLFAAMLGLMLWFTVLHKVIIRVHEIDSYKTLRVKSYKVREVKKDGITLLKPANPLLKWITIEIKPPNQPMTWYYQKNKKILNVYKSGNGSYEYIKFQKRKGETPTYGVVDEDMKLWVGMQLRQTELKYSKPDFMTKYGPIIAYTIVGTVFIMGLIIIADMIPG